MSVSISFHSSVTRFLSLICDAFLSWVCLITTYIILCDFTILMLTFSAHILFEGEASALQSPLPAVQSLF